MAMGWIGCFLMTTIDERFKKSLFLKKVVENLVMSEKKLYLCCVDKLTVEFE